MNTKRNIFGLCLGAAILVAPSISVAEEQNAVEFHPYEPHFVAHSVCWPGVSPGQVFVGSFSVGTISRNTWLRDHINLNYFDAAACKQHVLSLGGSESIHTVSTITPTSNELSVACYVESGGQTSCGSDVRINFQTELVEVPEDWEQCEAGDQLVVGEICGTWDEYGASYAQSWSEPISYQGCEYVFSGDASAAGVFLLDYDVADSGDVECREVYESTGEELEGDDASEAQGGGVPVSEQETKEYCDETGGHDGNSFCDSSSPDHPDYDGGDPVEDPPEEYCDENGGHDGSSYCSSDHPDHPDYDPYAGHEGPYCSEDGGSSGNWFCGPDDPNHPDYTAGDDGEDDGEGGDGGDDWWSGGDGDGDGGDNGEYEGPSQGACPVGQVEVERIYQGDEVYAVCVDDPNLDEITGMLDGLDMSDQIPTEWLEYPSLSPDSEMTADVCTCPEDFDLVVFERELGLSFGPLCSVAGYLRPLLLALVYLMLGWFIFRMLAGGGR